MKLGASYYPEVRAPELWRTDLQTARELGLSCLRCGEFAWAMFNVDGRNWSSRAALRFLDLAGEMGFEVIWCTPSAAPPPWVLQCWTDLHAVNQYGNAVPAGVRRNYCPSHREYMQLCAQTAERLGAEMGSHPALVGWQVDNELAGDGFTCWCERCRLSFHKWLQQRYGTLEALNARWQTGVWSQVYTDWSQIPVPIQAFGAHAPSLKLAYRRFRNDSWLTFYRVQADALRNTSHLPVTTNWYNYDWDVPFDQWKWRPHVDVIGISHYMHDEANGTFQLALLRGVDEKPLWVLEQRAGTNSAQNRLPDDPNRIRAHAQRCRTYGARFGIYWHLLQHAAGCEAEHGAVLRHDGRPTRIAQQIRRAAGDPAEPRVGSTLGSCLVAYSFQQHWAQQFRPNIPTRLNYTEELAAWHQAACNLWQDVRVAPFDAIARHRGVLLLPMAQMEEPGLAESLKRFLANGGTLITTGDIGRLDEENNVVRRAPMAFLGALGADVPDMEWFQLDSETRMVGTLDETAMTGRAFWLCPLQPLKDDVVSCGSLAIDDLAGPAALRFTCCGGQVIAVLTAPNPAGMQALLQLADHHRDKPVVRRAFSMP